MQFNEIKTGFTVGFFLKFTSDSIIKEIQEAGVPIWFDEGSVKNMYAFQVVT